VVPVTGFFIERKTMKRTIQTEEQLQTHLDMLDDYVKERLAKFEELKDSMRIVVSKENFTREMCIEKLNTMSKIFDLMEEVKVVAHWINVRTEWADPFMKYSTKLLEDTTKEIQKINELLKKDESDA
jgi:hypothetical protein